MIALMTAPVIGPVAGGGGGGGGGGVALRCFMSLAIFVAHSGSVFFCVACVCVSFCGFAFRLSFGFVSVSVSVSF